MPEPKKILIVDDDPDAVEFASAIVSEIEGTAIESANDAESGLAKAREIRPDVVLLDVDMPGRNGLYVFAELKKDPELHRIPVVMLTGIAERLGVSFSSDDMKEFLGKKPEAYIDKPVDPDKLRTTVRAILAATEKIES